MPEFPIKGICYAPIPCDGSPNPCKSASVTGGEDMAQDGYKNQWGDSGRDDLGIMSRMGANMVRLYHPIGDEQSQNQDQPDHSVFLDAAQKANLKVFAAVHQYLPCDKDTNDCYPAWHKALNDGLKKGFASNGKWHPSVWAVNMNNEVDTSGLSKEKQMKMLLSAIDAMLAAEKEQGVEGTVKITSCWTSGLSTPLGPNPYGTTIWGPFTTVENWIKDTSLVDYTPKTVSMDEFTKAIDSRWVHCMNVQIPWINGLDNMVGNVYPYARTWFVGEMGWNGAHQDAIENDLKEMNSGKYRNFLGSFAFQFQTAYEKGGSELNFGMFSLGSKTLGYNVQLQGKSFDVQCLTTRLLPFDPELNPNPGPNQCTDQCNHRAEAVAAAFGGSISGNGVCKDDTPVSKPKAQELKSIAV
jgi:hypothetical protein